MSKKNLDELFQEKFLDFKEMPDERVWHSIEASLNKKTKKRILPLWLQIGGVAAALVLGLLLFNPFRTTVVPQGQVTDRDAPALKEGVQDNDVSNQKDQDKNTPAVGKETPKTPGEFTPADASNGLASEDNNGIKEENRASGDGQPNPTGRGQKMLSPTHGTVAQTNSVKEGNKISSGADGNTPPVPFGDRDLPNKENAMANTTVTANNEKAGTKDSLHLNKDKHKAISNTGNSTAVAQQEVQEPDTEYKVAPGTKSIFEAIEDQEEEVAAGNPSKKWSAGPSIAPVYFNALGQGSPVHSIFVPNAKSGDVNLSYGVTVAYAINKKFSVRSGVHRVDFGYDTNDVAFSSSLVASTNGQIDNIDYRPTSKNLVLSSRSARNAAPEANSAALDAAVGNPAKEGVMSQQFGYLEVPVELNYALLDRKFGINLIGGVSSLFLMENSVGLSSGDLTMEMGEANNVNALNFSTNVGLGMNYKFNQNLQLNVEPMFKYQLNTFSETDGTFRPYTIGVYSGLSFRF